MSTVNTLYQILDSPRVTEKSTFCLEQGNQVVFRVSSESNKRQIKAAVEKMFKVEVVSVQTSNVPGKTKRIGRTVGRRKNWKKAVVRLAEGQKVDFFEAH